MIVEKEGIKVHVGSHEGKRVIIGSDHRGFQLKEHLKPFLKNLSNDIVDVGCHSINRVDYPVYSEKIAEEMIKDPLNIVGIAICGSGIGIGIPAGKFKGVYPARCLDSKDAVSSRKHNNANLLTLSADKTSLEEARKIIESWFTTRFFESPDEEPHLKRFLEIVRIESKI